MSRVLSENFRKTYSLKDQMGLAPFIDNTNILGIDLRQAWVPGASAFIEQYMAFLWPGLAFIKTNLNSLVGPVIL